MTPRRTQGLLGGRSAQVARETAELPTTSLLRRLALVGFVAMFAFTGFEATFSLFGDRRFGLTEASTSVVFLCIGVVLVAMQGGAYAKLVERHGVGPVLYGGMALVVAGLAVSGNRSSSASSDASSSAGAPVKVTLSEFKIEPQMPDQPTGPTQIIVTNAGTQVHNLTFESLGLKTPAFLQKDWLVFRLGIIAAVEHMTCVLGNYA